MSPLRCTGMKSSPTSSSTEWICSGKNTVDSVWEERKKEQSVGSQRRVKKNEEEVTCSIPAGISSSWTDDTFCSVATLAYLLIHILYMNMNYYRNIIYNSIIIIYDIYLILKFLI